MICRSKPPREYEVPDTINFDSITWNDGMLENAEKRIHPTERGALALYSEAVTTVPELLELE